MKIHILALTIVLAAAQTGQAQVKDLAELFPSKTRVYLEINGIADVVKEVRGLVKGSCLEDPPKSLEKFAKLADNQLFIGEFLEYGLFLCPEALSEIRNIHISNADDEALLAEERLTAVEDRDVRRAARERQTREDIAQTYPAMRRS